MRLASTIILLATALFSSASQAETTIVCTAVADAATGRLLKREGDCSASVTPASTFKIAISLMGYDTGFLKDESQPILPFEEGYPDWRPEWKVPTGPSDWMSKSVVWYSQQITRSLGKQRFKDYITSFNYGNEDTSGRPGKNDGLTEAWLSSSLKISPLGQLDFLQKVVRRELPVSSDSFNMTGKILDNGVLPSGWHLYGKTGAGLPTDTSGVAQPGRPYGWFVGWATKDDRTVVFARLIQDNQRQTTPPGARARDSLIRDLFETRGGF